MAGTKASGNTTERRGRKFRRDIRLSKEAGAQLRALWYARRGLVPTITEDEIVNDLIAAAWGEYDDEITSAAEKAAQWEGEMM